jgi:hypothetical protein
MMEEGTLSIVWHGTRYQVRYASNNPHDQERRARACPDEADLAALLHHCGTELAVIAQVCADVRQGKMAVLLVVVAAEQLQAFFPPIHRFERTFVPKPSQNFSQPTENQLVRVKPISQGQLS